MIAMEKRYYFDRPKQVVFADPENPGDWLCGIAYRDEVICSCCGGVFEIDEVVKTAAEDGVVNPFYLYEDWSDLTDDICGGVLPEGLQFSDSEENPGIVETVKVVGYEQMMFEDEIDKVGAFLTEASENSAE